MEPIFLAAKILSQKAAAFFLGHWVEDNLSALFAKMRQMPPRSDKPPESTHLEILAFLLESRTAWANFRSDS